jgi:hypothetical protein
MICPYSAFAVLVNARRRTAPPLDAVIHDTLIRLDCLTGQQ